MASRIAIVTGGNKGIGYEIVKKLAASGIKTVLTARNEAAGQAAVNALKAEDGLVVELRLLDVSDSASIQQFVEGFQKDYGKLDILVNNAAIAFKGSDPTPFSQQARPTFQTNYFGTVELTEKLIPLLRNGNSPRIVNVASQAGYLRIIPSQEKKDYISSDGITLYQLNEIANSFIHDVEAGVHSENGWPSTCYGFSKLLLIAYTKLLARREHPNIIVNACCPGYCKTDMSSQKGDRTAEEGARTPSWLAVSAASDTGKFFYNESEIQW